VLGIRPEHLLWPAAGAIALQAQLDVVESVGNEAFLHLRHGVQPLVARVLPQPLPEPGSRMPLGLAHEQLHLFDAENGLRINA
jgi:multiple sugar transport system ATP-binding protein